MTTFPMRGIISLCIAACLLLFCSLSTSAQPGDVFIAYPSPGGGIRYVTGTSDATYQVTPQGIGTRIRGVSDTMRVATTFTSFTNRTGVRIEPEEPVSYPVRIYNDEWPDGIEVKAYKRLVVRGTSGGGALVANANYGRLSLALRGMVKEMPIGPTRGLDLTRSLGVRDVVAAPTIHGMTTQDEQLLGLEGETQVLEPVLFSDPRVMFATYAEASARANFDNEGNIWLLGYSPFFPAIPITPELVDDSISQRVARTTKMTKDRRIIWSTYGGTYQLQGQGQVTFDKDNNMVSVITGIGRPTRSAGTYQELPRGMNDIAVSKIGPDGRLQWGTLVGGSGDELYPRVSTDEHGNIYVVFATTSEDLDVTDSLLNRKPNFPRRYDVGITSITADGKHFRWGTYWSSLDRRDPMDTVWVGSDPGGIVCDGHGGVIVGMSEIDPYLLPVTPGAWITEQKGGREGLLTRFSTDGNLLWSTLISTRGEDYVFQIRKEDDSTIFVQFEQQYHPPFSQYPRMAAIGVPGYDSTTQGNRSFVLRFGFDGRPRYLWAPWESKPYYPNFTPTGDGHYFRAALYRNDVPMEQSTPDSFPYMPAYYRGVRGAHLAPTFAIIDREYQPIFISSLIGITYDQILWATGYQGYLLVGAWTFSRGACLTDTLWGAGYGNDDGEMPYLVLLKPFWTTSAEEPGPPPGAPSHLQVFPNPAHDVLTVKAESAVSRAILIDILGRVVMTLSGNGTQAMQVDMRSVAPGSYVLRCETEQGVRQGMVVKQ